jgi:hypothetical protein
MLLHRMSGENGVQRPTRVANEKMGHNNLMNKLLIALLTCMACMGLASAQDASQAQSAPPQVSPADAKNHIGQSITVCGKVVDTKIEKYGIAGRGKPVLFYVDQPQTNPVFYFVAFGSKAGGPDEVIATYNGKNVCATGKVAAAGGNPYIMSADDHSNLKVKP